MQEVVQTDASGEKKKKARLYNRLASLGESISRAGLAEITVRLGTLT